MEQQLPCQPRIADGKLKGGFIRFFKHGVGNGWELNFVGKKYSLRIARHQLAFWKNYESIFNFSF